MSNNKVFKGFSKESIEFLREVKSRNSREWFQENRYKYEEFLLRPFQNLVSDLSQNMLAIDPLFEVRPQINKTISKIYRDTRFSKDKSIFKNQIWMTFKRPSRDWKDAPSYFFELMTDSYRYGLGYYSASRSTMDMFRLSIGDYRQEFMNAISFLKRNTTFELKGEKYIRPLISDYPDIIQNWYQRKSFYIVSARKIDKLLFSKRLKDRIKSGFNDLALLYHFLRNHVNFS